MGFRPAFALLVLLLAAPTKAHAQHWELDPAGDWDKLTRQAEMGDTISIQGSNEPPIRLGARVTYGSTTHRVFFVKGTDPPEIIKISKERLPRGDQHNLVNEARDLELLAERGVSPHTVVRAQEDGIFLRKRYLPGETFRDYLDGIPGLSLEEKARKVEEAMRFAKRLDDSGLFFGDLNPGNIVITREGQWAIIDPGGVYRDRRASPSLRSPGLVIAESLDLVPEAGPIRVALSVPEARPWLRQIVHEPDPSDPMGNVLLLMLERRSIAGLPEDVAARLAELNAEWLRQPSPHRRLLEILGVPPDVPDYARILKKYRGKAESRVLLAGLPGNKTAPLRPAPMPAAPECKPSLRDRFRGILGLFNGR